MPQPPSTPYRTPCRNKCLDSNGNTKTFSKAPYEEEHYNCVHATEAERWLYCCLTVGEANCGHLFLKWNAFWYHYKKFHPELLSLIAGKSRLDQENHREQFRMEYTSGASEIWDKLLEGGRNLRIIVPENIDELRKSSEDTTFSEEMKDEVLALLSRVGKLEAAKSQVP